MILKRFWKKWFFKEIFEFDKFLRFFKFNKDRSQRSLLATKVSAIDPPPYFHARLLPSCEWFFREDWRRVQLSRVPRRRGTRTFLARWLCSVQQEDTIDRDLETWTVSFATKPLTISRETLCVIILKKKKSEVGRWNLRSARTVFWISYGTWKSFVPCFCDTRCVQSSLIIIIDYSNLERTIIISTISTVVPFAFLRFVSDY